MALLLRKLRDLITMNRESPDSEDPFHGDQSVLRGTDYDPRLYAGDSDGDGGGSAASPILPPVRPDEQEASSANDLGGPLLKQSPVSKANGMPHPSFGQKLRTAIPGIIQGAISAGATPNIAGGGPTDIFRAAKAVGDDRDKKHLMAIKLADQRAQEQLRLAQIPWYQQRPDLENRKLLEKTNNDQANVGVKTTNAETGKTRARTAQESANAMNTYRTGKLGLDQMNAAVNARGRFGLNVPMMGAKPQPAMETPDQGSGEAPSAQPTPPTAAITPITEDQMTPAENDKHAAATAGTALKDAQTDNTQARTDNIGNDITWIQSKDDQGRVTLTAVPKHAPAEGSPAPVGTADLGKVGGTKPDPMVIAREKEELKRETADKKRSAESAELTTEGSKQMKETQSVARMFDDLLKRLEPYRGNNNPLTLTGPLAKYKLGVKSPEGQLGSDISNLSLASIQGMMPFASKSRNYEFIKKIGEHLPRLSLPLPDSPALIYDKLSKARGNFARFEASIRRYEVKHATGDSPAPKLSPENAAVYVRAAGGDKKKAMADAVNDGWDVTK